jgi:integrase
MLTDAKIRNAKAKDKPYKLADGAGMYLLVTPNGAKLWRLKYRVGDGKHRREKVLAFGAYPEIPLAGYERRVRDGDTLSKEWIDGAREKRDRAKRQLADGMDPSLEKQKRAHAVRLAQRVSDVTTFKGFAAHWVAHDAKRQGWSPGYKVEVEQSIAGHLEPLHRTLLTQITAPLAVSVLRTVEDKAPMMAEKVRRRLRAILDFAVEEGLLQGNPLPARRKGPKLNRRHFPAVTKRAGIGEILRKARAADPAKGIARAHLLIAFTAQRIAEVVGAAWDEFDLDGATWTIPRERMKVRDEDRGPHQVPIPPRLLAELKQWRAIDGPDAVLVCPAPRDAKKPITPEGVEKHYRDALGLAGKHSPHSWRSAFKTVTADAGKDTEVVEAQLDHGVGNKVASAYDRAKRLELRRTLMNWYERELVAARDDDVVVPLTRAKR